MTIITRFAPSPTGYLHIGGARTALFNKLWARHNGGKYLVRIEDTDKVRSTQEAVDAIHTALNWLDLAGDAPIIFQSDRQERHVEVANKLLEKGAAYRDFTTEAEKAVLEQAHKDSGNKGPFRYQSPWRDHTGPTPDLPFTVRLKQPRIGKITVRDHVQGEVKVDCRELDDMVLLRSDGTPTYMLAVVVDDFDMGVNYVIRGDDHFNNAFRQLPIYTSMGWPEPEYAHIPLIFSEDGKKLSKRTGAAGVEEYMAMGIQSEAMLNYLVKLGWGHGDDEIFTMKQAAKWFELKDVGRAPARINAKKLKSISQQYIKNTSAHDLFVALLPKIIQSYGVDGTRVEQFWLAIESLKPRVTNLNELYDGLHFMFAKRPLHLDEKAQAKINTTIVRDLYSPLMNINWDAAELEVVVNRYLEEHPDLKLIEVATSLRAALTGRTVSPPIYDVMLALGRDETLARMKDRFWSPGVLQTADEDHSN